MKYIVDVKDVSYGRVEVEADSVEQAEEKAQDLYFSGQVNWDAADVSYEASPDERKQERLTIKSQALISG